MSSVTPAWPAMNLSSACGVFLKRAVTLNLSSVTPVPTLVSPSVVLMDCCSSHHSSCCMSKSSLTALLYIYIYGPTANTGGGGCRYRSICEAALLQEFNATPALSNLQWQDQAAAVASVSVCVRIHLLIHKDSAPSGGVRLATCTIHRLISHGSVCPLREFTLRPLRC
jgi:hypothetical protein